MEPPEFWSFRVDNWELGDTLGDVAVGQELELALLCSPDRSGASREFVQIEGGKRSATRLEWNRYAVSGEVAFRGKECWVLDFGIPVACENPLWTPPSLGAFVTGRIELGSLTAGDWGDDLFEPPAPPLVFVWLIERVWRETTPPVEIALRTYQRADVPPSFVEIQKTSWASDDGGSAGYLLDCRLLRRSAFR